MEDIVIILRDLNGGVYRFEFDDASNAMDYLVCELSEDFNWASDIEIMFVKHDGCCVYSALTADHILDFEDLVGYLC